MTPEERKRAVAKKFSVDVSELRAFKDYGDRVAIVIPSGQKFVITIQELPPIPAPSPESDLPDPHSNVIANPDAYDLVVLRLAAVELGIPGVEKMNKRALVSVIKAWKKQNEH